MTHSIHTSDSQVWGWSVSTGLDRMVPLIAVLKLQYIDSIALPTGKYITLQAHYCFDLRSWY